jgi:hypothetical protein
MESLAAVFPYLILAAILATVAVLAVGVLAMLLRGGPFNAKYSNKLMRMRVAFQATAVALFLLFLLIMKGVG